MRNDAAASAGEQREPPKNTLKAAPMMLGRWGFRATLCLGMLGAGAGITALVGGISANGTFWALLPGSVLWDFFGGVAFVAVFVAAGSGVAPAEQGVASGLATTAKEIGGAMGLAVFVAVANAGPGARPTPARVLGGLHAAGWTAAAVTAAGGLIALILKRPSAPAPQDTTTVETLEGIGS
ncbi:hypothetical protein [Actinoallomurus sp. NPDC050550]|uniref:hypothetical protein n=1 Tax=Actinoallomurus sp. NPDC050550 TaxID=3154937 RepID=UPI0033EA7B3D